MNVHLAEGPVSQWYRDSCSCLHTTLASLALRSGVSPLDIFGRSLNLRPEKNVRHVEYYAPSHEGGNYVQWICPETSVFAEWVPCPSLENLAVLVDTRPVILPVDNYHLPFRPAHRDVHAAHLVLVTAVRGVSGEREFHVSDAQPPAYQGWISEEALAAAWYSPNPVDEQDDFFSGASSVGQVLLPSLPSIVSPQGEAMTHAIIGARRLLDTGPGSIAAARAHWSDLTGSRGPDLYVLGWWHQAQAHLHGEFLSQSHPSDPDVLARMSDASYAVADAWSPVRVAAARGYPHLQSYVSNLLASYEAYAHEAICVVEGHHE